MDTLAKLELKIGEIVAKVKELEKTNDNLTAKNEKLEAELKARRLELEQQKEKNEQKHRSEIASGQVSQKHGQKIETPGLPAPGDRELRHPIRWVRGSVRRSVEGSPVHYERTDVLQWKEPDDGRARWAPRSEHPRG